MRFIIIFFLMTFNLFAAPSESVLTDPKVTGRKANVSTLGTVSGLNTDAVPATTVFNGVVTVTTAGTRVQVSGSSVPIRSMCIKAQHADTGKIYVGNSTVASSNGYELIADTSVCLDVNNLNLVYIDSSVNGESASYAAVN